MGFFGKKSVSHFRMKHPETGKMITVLSSELTKEQRKSGGAGLIPLTKAPGKVARALWH